MPESSYIKDWKISNARSFADSLEKAVIGARSGHVDFVSVSMSYANSLVTVIRDLALFLEQTGKEKEANSQKET